MKRILFVEDESALQRAVSGILGDGGYRMLSALDGEEGLRLAREERPDLILLDLVLPKLDGFRVLEALKGDAATREIPIIILTNLEGSQDVERALALGATTYLVKTNYNLGEEMEKIKQLGG